MSHGGVSATFVLAFGCLAHAGSTLVWNDLRIATVVGATNLASVAGRRSPRCSTLGDGTQERSYDLSMAFWRTRRDHAPCAFVDSHIAGLDRRSAGVLVVAEWFLFLLGQIVIDDVVVAVSVHGFNGLGASSRWAYSPTAVRWRLGAALIVPRKKNWYCSDGVRGLFERYSSQLIAQLARRGHGPRVSAA